MKILSFDTTNNLASVAVICDGVLLSTKTTIESSLQAESLFHLIDSCLIEAKLELENIDLVSVANGPGSFTGVRIGLSAALGMQMHCKAKFIALSNFQVLAYLAKDQNKAIAVLLDARRNELYYQLFDIKLKALNEAVLVNASEFSCPANTICIGDGQRYLPWSDVKSVLRPNAMMLGMASEYFLNANDYSALIPLYIREPDAIAWR